jgi:multimeric flavodoxin WrbA
VKVVAIMGSPHKGNTLEITQRIEDKLKQMGDVEFEYVHLKDVDLKPCKGCFVCFLKGEEFCPLKDDREGIAQKLEEADGVIFASPVYSMHVSYLFKIFVDRFAYNFHRPRYFGKYALAVAAAGNPGVDETLKYLKGMATVWGFDVVDGLGFIAPPRNTSLPVLIERKDRTDEVVREFYQAMRDQRPKKLKLTDYLMFHSTRTVYSRVGDKSPTDHKYFEENGWFAKDVTYYHDNVRGNFFADRLARIMASMMGRRVDKALAKTA